MAKKKEEKPKEAEEEKSENIIEEEKSEEKEKEKDYNSLFDDDYDPDAEETSEDQDDSDEDVHAESEQEPEEADAIGDTQEDDEVNEREQEKDKSKDSSSKKSSNDKKKDEPKKDKTNENENKDVSQEDEIVLKEEKPKKEGKGFPTKKVLVALAVLLALLIGAFGGYLYFKNSNKPKEEPQKTETKKEEPQKTETKKEVYVTADGGLNMREEANSSSKSLALIPNGTKLTVLEEKDGWYKVEYNGQTGWVSKDFVSESNPLTYTSDDYGFQLTFPSNWANYKVVKKDVDNGDGTSSPVLYVGIKVADANNSSTVGEGYADMFAISVLTPAQWNTMQSSEGPQPAYIVQSSKYVFVWSPSQAGPDEVTDEREQVKDIIKTFKLL